MPIDGINLNTKSLNQGSSGQAAEPEQGSWRGNTVLVASKGCDIAGDAAEEISMEHSERAEEKRTLEERTIEEHPPLLLPQVEKILQYLDAVGHDTPEKALKEFVDALKRQGQQASPRAEARSRFGGTTEQFMAMSYAAWELERQGGHETLLTRVRDELEGLMADFSGSIRADINTVGVAVEFGRGDKDEVRRFQAGYRDAVLCGENLTGMLRATLERFGEGDFRRGVEHLIEALGNDLAGLQGPSRDPVRLNAVLQDLYLLEVLSTVLDGCQGLTARMNTEHRIAPIDASRVLQDLVAAAGDRWTSAARMTGLADKHGARDIQPKIGFLTIAKNLIKEMPVKVFPDPEARQNVVNAAQTALNEAIEREEGA